MTPAPLDRAVSLAGSQKALGDLIGAGKSFVNQWVCGVRPIPAEYCPKIESATGVRCEELRSDIAWERGDDGRVTGYRVPLAAA